MSGQAKALQPEDVTRLIAERLNVGDAAGVAARYGQQPCWPTPLTAGDRPSAASLLGGGAHSTSHGGVASAITRQTPAFLLPAAPLSRYPAVARTWRAFTDASRHDLHEKRNVA